MKLGIYETMQSLKAFHSKKVRLRLIFFSLVTGILTGCVVSAYNFLLKHAVLLRNSLIEKNTGYSIIFIILLFLLIACFIQFTVTKFPMISGSGIPQVMGLIQNKFKFNWLPELLFKFLSGLMAIFIGFSMGREGPSIHLGALVGEGINKITKRNEIEKKYLITAGSSAGLAATFNAPLAGAVFAVEELHKFFTPILLVCVLIATLFSNMTAKFLLGNKLSFSNFKFITPIEYNIDSTLLHILLIILLSFIMVLFAKLFNYFIVTFKQTYDKIPFSNYAKISTVALISLLIILFLPEITGGGHELVEHLFNSNITFKILLLFFIGKFLFTMLCYATGSPGGIFLPLLVIGALIGKIYGMTLSSMLNISSDYANLFILIAMTSYFTAVVRTPITGIILILEMSGNFSNLFSLAIASAITYLLSELFNQNSVYEILYENMLDSKNYDKEIKNEKIVTFKIPVTADSKLSNKKIKEIQWPKNLLVVGIVRNGIEFIPDGETTLLDSDILIFITDESTSEKYIKHISNMGLNSEVFDNI